MMELHPILRNVVLRANTALASLEEHTRVRSTALKDFCVDRSALIRSSIIDDCYKPKPVTIALVGETGSGKSTLLNAILGYRILPVGNMKACTAVIAEVSYEDTRSFKAEIEFVTRDSWDKEVRNLIQDLIDAKRFREEAQNTSMGEQEEVSAISKAAMDKLKAVYGQGPDQAFDPNHLVELPEIREALDGGRKAIVSEDFEKFRTELSVFLNSKQRFWPIVQTVRVRGPFQALSNGITLVDLPGLNDPNEAREAVTHGYLKTSRFVWIVFSVSRTLKKEMFTLMQRDEFLRQVVMDGRDEALTFVGTSADAIDLESGREEFSLPDDADAYAIISARNQEVRNEIARQLDELADRVAQMAQANDDQRLKLHQQFRKSQVYTVSAREYMRLANIAKNNPGGMTTVDQTEVPALHKHMDRICASYGISLRAGTHLKQLALIAEEIRSAIKAEYTRVAQQVNMSEQKREEAKRAASAARNFLREQLEKAQEEYQTRLKEDQETLLLKLDQGIKRGESQLDRVLRGWSDFHWATLHATVRRDGRFASSTGKKDLPADLANPILNTISVAWAEYFGDKLGTTIDKASVGLRKIAQEFAAHLVNIVQKVGGDAGEYANNLKQLVKSSEKVLDEIVSQSEQGAREYIEEQQRTLYERILKQIEANMRTSFRRAAGESGYGMKQRMLGALSEGAKSISVTMYDDVRKEIHKGMRSVVDVMGRKYEEMAEHIKRQSQNSIDNIYKDEALVAGEAHEESELLSGLLKSLGKAIEAVEKDISSAQGDTAPSQEATPVVA